MYIIVFKPEVYDDIKVAYDWYEKQRVGLGEDFLLTLEVSYEKMARTPKVYTSIYKNVRRKLTSRFPYGIFFVLEDKQIIVIAIIHTKRDSSIWSNRL